MAVFSTNQNRQLYVAGAYKTISEGTVASNLTTVGDVTITKDRDGNLHIHQLGYGGLVKSDAINPASITYAKASAPADMALKLKKVTLTLDSTVGSGRPIAGQDYIVRVNFRQMYGMSDQDIYQKYGAVHATSAMAAQATTDLFWLTMAESLVKNFSRCYSPLLTVALVTTVSNGVSTAATAITSIKKVGATWYVNGSAVTPGTTYKGIDIIEKSQASEWSLGTAQLTPVYFEVIPTTVFDGTDEVTWGITNTANSGTTVGNGYNTADLEYFCMGERGDQYRNAMWPKNIKTKYMVNETHTYYYLDIHYSYSGSCEDIQKSEKDITIVSDTLAAIKGIAKVLTDNGITIKATAAAEDAIQAADTTSPSTENNGILDSSELS